MVSIRERLRRLLGVNYCSKRNQGSWVHLPPTQLLCVNVWILCRRYLEAEEMEKTYRFKQEDIAAAVPLASSVQVRRPLLVIITR